jgi:outer membrane protein TolC
MTDRDFNEIWEQVGKEVEIERDEIDAQIAPLNEELAQVRAELDRAIDERDIEQIRALFEKEKKIADRIFELLDQWPSALEHGIRAFIEGLRE